MSAQQNVRDYLTKLHDSATKDDLKLTIGQFRDFYDKKLWYQLSNAVESLLANQNPFVGPEIFQFYSGFVKDWEGRINQLKLVRILHLLNRNTQDIKESIAIFQKTSERLSGQHKDDKEAISLCLSELAHLYLRLDSLAEAKDFLEKSQKYLEGLTGADPFVYSELYKGWTLYYKKKIAPTEFCKHTLLYLAYTPLTEIPLGDQQTIAFDVGIAALVSQDIYNFGELLAQDLLNSLIGTPGEFLKHLLLAVNSGNIAAYDKIKSEHQDKIKNQAALTSKMQIIDLKIRISALMEVVFGGEKTLTFDKISTIAKVSKDDVELLVMKALSLGLIKGSIDELQQIVTIEWIQPRVLDKEQVGKLKERVDKWFVNVKDVLHFVQNQTAPELLS